jgi:hypothetical protein
MVLPSFALPPLDINIMKGGCQEGVASRSLDQSSPDRPFLVAEDRHRGFHAPEAEFLVKALGTGIGVQDDLLVAGG